MRQESAWFDKHNPDTLVSAMNTQIKDVGTAFGEKMAMVLKATGMVFSGVCIAFVIGWKFAFASIVFTPFYWFILKYMGHYMV